MILYVLLNAPLSHNCLFIILSSPLDCEFLMNFVLFIAFEQVFFMVLTVFAEE